MLFVAVRPCMGGITKYVPRSAGLDRSARFVMFILTIFPKYKLQLF